MIYVIISRIACFATLMGFIDAEHYGKVPHDSGSTVILAVCMGVLWAMGDEYILARATSSSPTLIVRGEREEK